MKNFFAVVMLLGLVVVPALAGHTDKPSGDCVGCHKPKLSAVVPLPAKPVATVVAKAEVKPVAKPAEVKPAVKAEAVKPAVKAETKVAAKAEVKKVEIKEVSEKGWTKFHVNSHPIANHVTAEQAIRAYGQSKSEVRLRFSMLRELAKGVTSTGTVKAGQKFILVAFWAKSYAGWGYKQILAKGEVEIQYYGESFKLGRDHVQVAVLKDCLNPVLVKAPAVRITKAVEVVVAPPVVETVGQREVPPPAPPVKKEVLAPPVKEAAVKEVPIPPMPEFFPGPTRPDAKTFDMSGCGELTTGAGIYESMNWPHTGFYHWTHGRCLPVKVGEHWSFGVNAGYGLGSGKDNKYNYDWNRFYAGPSAKYMTDGWSLGGDVALGKQSDNGGEAGYKSSQDSTLIRVGIDYDDWARRMEGKNWFPKFKVGANGFLQVDGKKTSSVNSTALNEKAWDNTTVELMLTQGIYDLKMGNNILITPNARIGVGHEFGPEVTYAKFGPGVEVEYKGEKILEIGALNYKANLTGKSNDQIEWLSGMLDIGGTYRAIKKSLITEVKEDPKPVANVPVQVSKVGPAPAAPTF